MVAVTPATVALVPVAAREADQDPDQYAADVQVPVWVPVAPLAADSLSATMIVGLADCAPLVARDANPDGAVIA